MRNTCDRYREVDFEENRLNDCYDPETGRYSWMWGSKGKPVYYTPWLKDDIYRARQKLIRELRKERDVFRILEKHPNVAFIPINPLPVNLVEPNNI